MCDGRRFQADGAATEKELFESWRLNRGTIKICIISSAQPISWGRIKTLQQVFLKKYQKFLQKIV